MVKLAGRLIEIDEQENHELLDDPLETTYAPNYARIPPGARLTHSARIFLRDTVAASRIAALGACAGTTDPTPDEFRTVDIAFASSHSAEEVTRTARGLLHPLEGAGLAALNCAPTGVGL